MSDGGSSVVSDGGSSVVDTPVKKVRKQKTKGVNLGPGGELYLYTLKDSLDWNYGTENQSSRWGMVEQQLSGDRLKQHAREHPLHKIEIVGLWKIDMDVRRKESEISKKLQLMGFQIHSPNTSTSDFYKGDPKSLKDIINHNHSKNEIKPEDYPELY